MARDVRVEFDWGPCPGTNPVVVPDGNRHVPRILSLPVWDERGRVTEGAAICLVCGTRGRVILDPENGGPNP